MCCPGASVDQSVSAQPCPAPALGFQAPFPVAPAVVKSSTLLPWWSLRLLTLELSLAFLGVKAGLRYSLCPPLWWDLGQLQFPGLIPLDPQGFWLLVSLKGQRKATQTCKGIYAIWGERRDRKDPEVKLLPPPPALEPSLQNHPVGPAMCFESSRQLGNTLSCICSPSFPASHLSLKKKKLKFS